MQGSADGLLQVTEIIPVGIVDERNKITSQMTVSKHIKSVLILLCKDLIIRNLHNITDSADGANCHIDLQMMKFSSQEGNIYFYIIVFCIGIESPDLCGNLVFLENLITVIHKNSSNCISFPDTWTDFWVCVLQISQVAGS